MIEKNNKLIWFWLFFQLSKQKQSLQEQFSPYHSIFSYFWWAAGLPLNWYKIRTFLLIDSMSPILVLAPRRAMGVVLSSNLVFFKKRSADAAVLVIVPERTTLGFATPPLTDFFGVDFLGLDFAGEDCNGGLFTAQSLPCLWRTWPLRFSISGSWLKKTRSGSRTHPNQ